MLGLLEWNHSRHRIHADTTSATAESQRTTARQRGGGSQHIRHTGHVGTERHQPLPADGLTLRWDPWAGGDGEEVVLRWDNEAWTVSGHSMAARVQWVLRLSPLWQVRQFLLFRDLEMPDLWLGTDGGGRWGEVNGAHRPDLDGATDIIVGCSGFDYAPLLRRTPVDIGQGITAPIIRVDTDTLGLSIVVHTLARTAESSWEITDHEAGDTWTLDVDQHGIPTDIVDRHRRR